MKQLIQGMLLGLVLAGTQAWAAVDAGDRLNKLLSAMETIDADFTQLLLDAGGSRLQENTGHFTLKRPGLFRWETEEPYPQLTVSDGSTLWLYDPDLEQATKQQMDQRLTHTPALLLSGDIDTLTETFKIRYERQGDLEHFTLLPKTEDTLFELMRLTFEDGRIQGLQMEDSLGQQTSVQLENTVFNQPVDSDLFQFTPPPGTDIIAEQ